MRPGRLLRACGVFLLATISRAGDAPSLRVAQQQSQQQPTLAWQVAAPDVTTLDVLPSGQLLQVVNRQLLIINTDGALAVSYPLRPGDATPAITPSADGTVIYVSDGDSVVAIALTPRRDSSKPATPVWTFTPKPPSPDIAINFTHPPAVDPVTGMVYAITRAANKSDPTAKVLNLAYAVRPSNGVLQWSVRVASANDYNGGFEAPPAAVPRKGLLVELESGKYYFLSITDGGSIWAQGYGYAFAGRPVISEDGKTALVKGGLYASLIAVNLANGNSTWYARSFNNVMPAALGSVVFVPVDKVDYYHTVASLLALDITTGKEVWKALLPTTARAVASPAVSDDTVFLATNEPAIYAFNILDGRQLWSWPMPQSDNGSKVLVEQLVFSSHDNRLYYLADGKLHALDLPTPSVQPTKAQGGRPRH